MTLAGKRGKSSRGCTTHLHNGGHVMLLSSYSNLIPPSPSGTGGVEKHSHRRAPRLGILFLFFVAATFLVAALPAPAQQVTGAIVGTVVDPTGAAVAGATITARDTERGTSLTTRSDATGSFDLPDVPVGNYRVTVEAKGFQKAAYPQFNLVLNQTARLNFQMKIGQATETVEVIATAPILQTDTSLLGSIIDSKIATDLPLSTHNTNQLTLISSAG